MKELACNGEKPTPQQKTDNKTGREKKIFNSYFTSLDMLEHSTIEMGW